MKLFGISVRAGWWVVIVAVITLEATGIIQFLYAQRGIKQEASHRAESELRSAGNKIMDIVDQAESAVINSVWIAEWCLLNPDSLVRVPQRIVDLNPVVTGSTIALVPGYSKKYPFYAPYVTRHWETGKMEVLSLATEEYNYPEQEWFVQPLQSGEGYWSEPYFDEGGGNILMTTFSEPVKGTDGKIAAILTADISLEWLSELMENARPYPDAYSVVTSRDGNLMVCTDTAFVDSDERTLTYSVPVQRTGWTLTIHIPEDNLYAEVRRVALVVIFLQLIGIAMIILILHIIARNQRRYNLLDAQRNQIEHELLVASSIQMGMLPDKFVEKGERDDVQLYASLTPAKDVGGDLFDFYFRDDKLFFCIGDVSGKGVPASLVMACTRSVFHTVSAHESRPNKIMESMNRTIADMNKTNMFVTLFVGVLDLPTGHLSYCNAGHDAPLLVGIGVGTLPCDANIPIGFMPQWQYSLQETHIRPGTTIFLYTDGLTEAENANHAQFRLEQVKQVAYQALADNEQEPHPLIERMLSATRAFVGDAEQSDDLTMMAIQYTKQPYEAKMRQQLVFPNDLSAIPQLTTFIDQVCETVGCPSEQIRTVIESAVSEMIRYAYPPDKHSTVSVEAELTDDDLLSFTVINSGGPFEAPVPTTQPPAFDSVQYQREANLNTLSLKKKLKRSA